MSLRTDCDDELDDPIETLASIFARGVIRLRDRDIRIAELPPDSGVHGLALCSTSRPCGVDGSNSPLASRRKDE